MRIKLNFAHYIIFFSLMYSSCLNLGTINITGNNIEAKDNNVNASLDAKLDTKVETGDIGTEINLNNVVSNSEIKDIVILSPFNNGMTNVNEFVKLKAYVVKSDNTKIVDGISWESAEPKIARIVLDKDGNYAVEAISEGYLMIRAIYKDGKNIYLKYVQLLINPNYYKKIDLFKFSTPEVK